MRSLASPPPQTLATIFADRDLLEDELGAYLTDTTWGSRGGLTELAAIGISDHAARKEVGVVEDIEHLEAEI